MRRFPCRSAGPERDVLNLIVPEPISRVKFHGLCWFCPSSRSFGLFAAAGRDQDRRPRRACQGRSPAGAGAHRHRQHVRCAGVFRQDGGLGHSADCRLCRGGRFRGYRGGVAQLAGIDPRPHRAAGGAGGRLPQPDETELTCLPRNAGPSGATHQVRLAAGRDRGPDRLDRRSGGPNFACDQCRSGGLGCHSL